MSSKKKKETKAEEPNNKNSERAWEDNYGILNLINKSNGKIRKI